MTLSDLSYNKAKNISNNFFFIKKNILAQKSLSLAYIFYRVFRPILKLYYKQFKIRHQNTPWTTPASIIIFKELLTRDMIGFEYGSGKSTLFFAGKLKRLVSVEHNKEWFKLVNNEINERGITNVDYHYIPQNHQNMVKGTNFHTRFALKDFEIIPQYFNYFEFIKSYPDGHFDFIIVDGRARVECTLNALDKLKSGGMLVLDNSERPRYKPVHRALKKWKQVYTTNGLTDTTIWFKP